MTQITLYLVVYLFIKGEHIARAIFVSLRDSYNTDYYTVLMLSQF